MSANATRPSSPGHVPEDVTLGTKRDRIELQQLVLISLHRGVSFASHPNGLIGPKAAVSARSGASRWANTTQTRNSSSRAFSDAASSAFPRIGRCPTVIDAITGVRHDTKHPTAARAAPSFAIAHRKGGDSHRPSNKGREAPSKTHQVESFLAIPTSTA